MIITFVFIYFLSVNNNREENKKKLEGKNVTIFNMISPVEEKNSTEMQVVNVEGNFYEDLLSFAVEIDKHGEIKSYNSFFDISEEILKKATELAWEQKKNYSVINIEEKKWMYAIVPMSVEEDSLLITDKNKTEVATNLNQSIAGHQKIMFLDVTASYQGLFSLFVTLLVVGGFMLFAILGISIFFAEYAVRPIKESWEKQKQFVADASHELKTPLSILQANTQVLLGNEDNTIKSQKKWLNYIQEETDRMAKLIGDLLYLAKSEETNGNMSRINFNISDTVNEVILTMEAMVFEKEILLFSEIEPNLLLKGEQEKIKRVLIILLDNAMKYTNPNGRIEMTLKKEKNFIIYKIKNSGRGIAKEDLPKLFDRFYRTDPSRSSETGGFGLGLPIAKTMVEKFGGKLSVSSVENESTTFTCSFKIR